MRFSPVIISHHMLMGLKEGQEKMSKSDPDSAIFMEDSVTDVSLSSSLCSSPPLIASQVNRKIKKAFCPPEVVEGNPIIDYAHHIVLGYYGEISITANGVCVLLSLPSACLFFLSTHPPPFLSLIQEAVTYRSHEELIADYRSGRIHPGDLKAAVAEALNRILDPVRRHFETGEPKKLLDKIKKYKITK
jgi:tyrosyl-tRNA synthetase